MIFEYKIGFFSSFDENHQNWVLNNNDNLINNFKELLSGSGILCNEFFFDLVLLENSKTIHILITSQLYNRLPSLSKFLKRIKKSDINYNENEVTIYFNKMKELMKLLSEDDNNQWYLIYQYK